jgi:hypothetical protein
MAKPEERFDEGPVKPSRLFTADEVKSKKTASGIGGTFFGIIITLLSGVIINKFAKVNITDKTTAITDSGIDKIKAIPQKFKKAEQELNDE